MKVWKKSIVSLAVAFALLASFIPAPMNIAAAVEVGDTITYDFALASDANASNSPLVPIYDEWNALGDEKPTTGNYSGFNASYAKKFASGFNSADYSEYTANGQYSIKAGSTLTTGEFTSLSYSSYANLSNKLCFNGTAAGLSLMSTSSTWFVTIRIVVPEAGWYSPTITTWTQEMTRGSIFRSYLAPVPEDAANTVLDTTQLSALREDKYSIGLASCISAAVYNKDKKYPSQQMRTVYLNKGEYAFTMVPEIPSDNYYIRIRNLTLKKVADEGVDASQVSGVKPDIALSTVIGTDAEIAGDETISYNVPKLSEKFDVLDTEATGYAANIAQLGDSIYNKLLTSKVTFSTKGVGASLANDCSKINVVGDVTGNGEITISLERDGAIATSSVNDITVTSDSTASVAYTYNFKEGDNGDRLEYDASNWSTKNEYSNVSNAKRWSTGIAVASGLGGWFTVRIKVDRPGYYTPELDAFNQANCGIGRFFISKISDAATIADRETVYCAEESSIGSMDMYSQYSNNNKDPDTGLAYLLGEETLRTVYFDKSGEYAFTVKIIGKNEATTSTYANIQSLKLTRIGLTNQEVEEVVAYPTMDVVPDNTTAAVEIGANTEVMLAPVMSNNAVEDLVSAKNITASANNSNVTVDITDVKNSYNCITGKALKLTGVSAGISTVTLTVTDAYGIVTTDTVEVTVTAPVVKCFGNMYAYLVGNENDGYKLWMFGGIDSDNYAEVGFEVAGTKIGGPKVYKQINIEYNNKANKAEITAETFNLTDGYVFYHTEDLGDSIADDEISVRAYAKDANGEYIYGEAVVIDPDADDSAASN